MDLEYEKSKQLRYAKHLAEKLREPVQESIVDGKDLVMVWYSEETKIDFFILRIKSETLASMSTEEGYNAVIEQIVPYFEEAIDHYYVKKTCKSLCI